MNDIKNRQPDDAELPPAEALLPWYATGRLSAEDQAMVENALASDGELRRRLALVRDEAADTVSVNESLGTPSAAAFDRLMAKVDAFEVEHPRRAAFGEKALGWLSRSLSALSPRTLAWSATAAALVICLQAGLLTSTLVERHAPQAIPKLGHAPTLASVPNQNKIEGTLALVSFSGTLSARLMTAFLEEHHAVLVGGPTSGLYKIKVADEKLSGDALNAKLAELRSQSDIFVLVLPAAE